MSDHAAPSPRDTRRQERTQRRAAKAQEREVLKVQRQEERATHAAAVQAEREAIEARIADAKARGTYSKFSVLGIQIAGGEIYSLPGFGKIPSPLGSLAGAQASVDADRRERFKDRHHRIASGAAAGVLTGGLGFALMGTKTKATSTTVYDGWVTVVFTNGEVVQREVSGKPAVMTAQREVAMFNALARAASG